jgi:hypothetical protein
MGVGAGCSPYPSANARKYSWFAFHSTERECSAAQVPPFIRHIIVPDMHQSTSFARQSVLNGHLGSTAITGPRHFLRGMVIP